MARNTPPDEPVDPASQGRLRQIWAVFQMTRKADPISVWYMLGALVGAIVIGLVIGLVIGHPIYLTILGAIAGVLLAVIILGRRAEKAAYSQIEGQPGAAVSALRGLRRGWNVEEEPIAFDPRTRDLVFRAIGRPGVVLVTEGPVPRVNRLADQERKRMERILPGVPVSVINAGSGENQVPLRKLSREIARKQVVLTKTQVSEVAKRVRALGGAKLPIPKGVDPSRMRPDRKATKGR